MGRRKRRELAKRLWSGGGFPSPDAAGAAPPAPPKEPADPREEPEGEGEEGEEGDGGFRWRGEWFGSDAEGDDEAEGADGFDEDTGDVADCTDVANRNNSLVLCKGWTWEVFKEQLVDAVPAADKAERKRAANAARSYKYDDKKREGKRRHAARGTMSMASFVTSGFDLWSQVRTRRGGPSRRLAQHSVVTRTFPSLTPVPRTLRTRRTRSRVRPAQTLLLPTPALRPAKPAL